MNEVEKIKRERRYGPGIPGRSLKVGIWTLVAIELCRLVFENLDIILPLVGEL